MFSSCRKCLLFSRDLLRLRQMGTKVKLIGQLDENVYEAVVNSSMKPRNHPGRIKNKIHEFPKRLQKAMQIVLKDQPIQVLCEEGAALNRYLKARHPPTLPEEGKKFPRRYNWKPVEYDNYTCLKYLVGRSAQDYSVQHRVFAEFTTRLPDFKPKSIFDFGSGIGMIPWAAHYAWGPSLKEIFCVDVSSNMNDIAEILLRGGYPNGELPVPGTFFRQFLPASHSRQYDIVASSFTLFEMSSSEARLNTLHNLWNKTKHFLVLVEQGSNAGFKLIEEAREFILYLSRTQPAHVFAPCSHETPCPRVQNQDGTPCNFEVGFEPILTRGGTMQKERFCYVILGKGVRPDSLPKWPRIVRPVLRRSGHTICRLCTSSGCLQEIILTASKDTKSTYKCAKVSEWGDLLPIRVTSSSDGSTSTTTPELSDYQDNKTEDKYVK